MKHFASIFLSIEYLINARESKKKNLKKKYTLQNGKSILFMRCAVYLFMKIVILLNMA